MKTKLIDLLGLTNMANDIRDWVNAKFQRKVDGKGLSTNDYDGTAKAKVDAIPADPKYTDTVYDDTALSGRVSTIEGKEDGWDAKQDTLVSGTNIKTVNGESLLGSGDIEIQGGGGGGEENAIEAITMNGASVPVTNKTAAITETDPTVPSWAKQSNKPSYNYSEIGNTPTIPVVPTNVSAFTNDAGYLTSHQDLSNYIQKSQTAGLIKNDGTVDTTQYGTYSKPSGGIPASDLASGVIPTVPVQDVTVGGTSVVSGGTAVIPQEVFWAEYGVTTSSELDTQLALGKILACRYDDRVHIFTRKIPASASYNYYWFAAVANDMEYYLRLRDDNQTWYAQNYQFQFTNNRVSSWQSTPDNVHYPTEKLVKNSIDAVADALTDYVQKSQTTGLLKNDGTVDTNTYLTQHQDISGKADKVLVASTQPAGGMLPNTLYNLGTLSGNTTFTLATSTDNTIANHYYWTFDTPSTAPTITWPQGITGWHGGYSPTIDADKHYEVSVLNGIAILMEV